MMVQTCWRGLVIPHPADWELVRVSAPNEAPTCTFADRRYERLRVGWRRQAPPGDLRRMFEQDPEGGKGPARSVLAGQPPGWHGMVTQLERAAVVHAGRFLEEEQMLVETLLIWPESRNVELENRIFAGIRAAHPVAGSRLWEAMGMKMWISEEFDLLGFRSDVGLVEWRFGPVERGHNSGGKHPAGLLPSLVVRRIALPEYWLTVPLDQWMEKHLPSTLRVTARHRGLFRGHETFSLESCEKTGILARVRGQGRVRLDVAWECPVEMRVYFATWEEKGTDAGGVLPAHVRIECCRRPQAIRRIQQ